MTVHIVSKNIEYMMPHGGLRLKKLTGKMFAYI